MINFENTQKLSLRPIGIYTQEVGQMREKQNPPRGRTKTRTTTNKRQRKTHNTNYKKRNQIRASYAKASARKKFKLWRPPTTSGAQNPDITPLYKLSRKNNRLGSVIWSDKNTKPNPENTEPPQNNMTQKTYTTYLQQLRKHIHAGNKRIKWQLAMHIYKQLAQALIDGEVFNNLAYFRRRKLLFLQEPWGETFGTQHRCNIIYMLMSPFVKKTYIGSTQVPDNRMKQHIRHGLRPLQKYDKIVMAKLYTYINKNRPHTWLMIPIARISDFPPDKQHKALLQEIEYEYIRMLRPELNTLIKGQSPVQHKGVHLLSQRKTGWNFGKNRPNRESRKRTRETRKQGNIMKTVHLSVTRQKIYQQDFQHTLKFTMTTTCENKTLTQTTFKLKEILKVASNYHLPLVFWEMGRCELTKWEFVKIHYGETLVIYNDKTVSLLEMITNIKSNMQGIFIIKQIKFLQHNTLGALRFLSELTCEKDRWHYLTHKLLSYDMDDLLYLRSITTKLKSNIQDRATEALDLVLWHKYKYKYEVDMVLKIPFSKQINRSRLLTQIKRIIKQSEIPAPIKSHILQPTNMKIVHTKTPSIKDQIRNYKKKICNTYDPRNPPQCMCKHSRLLNTIWNAEAFQEITFDDSAKKATRMRRSKGDAIRENTDIKTGKHVAFKSTAFRDMLEGKKHMIQSHRDHTNEYEDLLDVAEMMKMSSSNIPAPTFTDDIANIEKLLLDLTNKLITTMSSKTIPHHTNSHTQ